jgi:hypothetical protein
MSQVHLEHRKHLERELRNAGIKPEVQRTDGGHMRIVFEAGGKPQSILTSWTPSDHRSTLNARARIRKILRDTGTLDKAQPVGKLGKALSLPQQTEPFMERIAQLEHDVVMLLDMLALVATSTGVDLEPPPPPEPVIEVKVDGRHAPTHGPSRSKVHDLLLSIGYEWTPVATIRSRDARRSVVAVSVALNNLKKKGLVENGERGMWRKTPPVSTPSVEAPLPPAKMPAPQPTRGLLDCLEFQYLPIFEIERRMGFGGSRLAAALSYQKRLGRAENGMRGMWRKVAAKPNGRARHANGRAVHAPAR